MTQPDVHSGLEPEMARRGLRLRRILHPTDCSPESRTAFVHALKLAVASRAELDIVHIESDPQPADLERLPSVRKTLIEWGTLPHGASQHDVAALGITVRKLCLRADDASQGLLHFLAKHDEDLIVLSTHQRHGIDRWFRPEIATHVAMRSHVATLFVPADSLGFVNAGNGTSDLQHVVLPVDDSPSPQTAINLSAELIRSLAPAGSVPTFSVVHVGPSPMTRPDIRYPSDSGWDWQWLARGEDVVHDIVNVAEARPRTSSTTHVARCWLSTHSNPLPLSSLRV